MSNLSLEATGLLAYMEDEILTEGCEARYERAAGKMRCGEEARWLVSWSDCEIAVCGAHLDAATRKDGAQDRTDDPLVEPLEPDLRRPRLRVLRVLLAAGPDGLHPACRKALIAHAIRTELYRTLPHDVAPEVQAAARARDNAAFMLIDAWREAGYPVELPTSG